jgi:hypothetical protein
MAPAITMELAKTALSRPNAAIHKKGTSSTYRNTTYEAITAVQRGQTVASSSGVL